MNRKFKTVQDGIHSLGNASREVQKPYLKLILPSHQLTAVNCQSPGALLPITGLEQDIIKLRKGKTYLWFGESFQVDKLTRLIIRL